ncbi:hypothetical protein AALO_G00212290 [Alosa alosa]|uniref:TRIM8/14/16/25/29/45/65 coiled-coil region domain-containing protein n=1 Tax=Alosa alosa TaxID=278164 RepID=A0AAV6G001_9TELE|nr:hypothetical protein AALO_G00212290 [Alosa alosa]
MHVHLIPKELQKTQQSSQQKIQAKENNLTEFKQAMESLTNSEQVVMEDTEKVFEELVRMVKERCSEVKEVIRTQKKAELSQARTLLDQLHQEIAELRKKNSELEELSQIEDHLDFLQSQKCRQACHSVFPMSLKLYLGQTLTPKLHLRSKERPYCTSSTKRRAICSTHNEREPVEICLSPYTGLKYNSRTSLPGEYRKRHII